MPTLRSLATRRVRTADSARTRATSAEATLRVRVYVRVRATPTLVTASTRAVLLPEKLVPILALTAAAAAAAVAVFVIVKDEFECWAKRWGVVAQVDVCENARKGELY